MASVTKSSEEKGMADEEPEDQEESQSAKSKGDKGEPISYGGKTPKGPGYFTIYKKGQGYWTRIGTLLAVLLIGSFTTYNLIEHVPTMISDAAIPENASTELKNQLIESRGKLRSAVTWSVTSAFVVGYVWLCWRLLNKPTNVDFLIATDSEMKKVNWTSRKELIGSTKIVIIFMFLIAAFLFSVDQIFGTLMWLCKVVSVPPWGG
jgi:preprotein translocase SecE subunit